MSNANLKPNTKTPVADRPRGKNGRYTDLTAHENLEELKAKYTTKSALIRYLWDQGYERGTIAKSLGIVYQHVRNVLVKPNKKTPAANSGVTV